jgi:signal transduction histidine kinase
MSRTILVIEDDQDIARLVALHLRDLGYEVQAVHDGITGLRRATSQRYDLIILTADVGLMERVLENLSENALRYTPAGGSVIVALDKDQEHNATVEANAQPEKIIVHVSGTGCGIAPEDLPYVFERFYRVEKNGPAEVGGAGLGLSIAKRILELHGSPLHVSSTPNVGTTFSFHLPVQRIDPA